ncbi:hypothetical protein X801_00408 [Opisthorchis viverrini]|nr:hypothetical protein X801_00408 [Opisthorchis viverrini]
MAESPAVISRFFEDTPGVQIPLASLELWNIPYIVEGILSTTSVFQSVEES